MLRSEKKEFVAELESIYKDSNSVIFTHYHGLTVSQITVLRAALRAKGASFKVVKNTLSNIAAGNSGLASAASMFSGPTAIAYSDDLIAAAKVVTDFAKTNNNLKIVGGVIGNEFVDASGVEKVAKLPSLDELRAKIVGVLQAPATRIACVLGAPASKVARVLNAYATK